MACKLGGLERLPQLNRPQRHHGTQRDEQLNARAQHANCDVPPLVTCVVFSVTWTDRAGEGLRPTVIWLVESVTSADVPLAGVAVATAADTAFVPASKSSCGNGTSAGVHRPYAHEKLRSGLLHAMRCCCCLDKMYTGTAAATATAAAAAAVLLHWLA